MSIDIQIPKDLRKVDLNNLGELVWWSNHLNICPEELTTIVGKVGSSIDKVKEYRKMKRSASK